MLSTFFVFHLEISGKDVKDEHLKNKTLQLLTLLISHFEISGIEVNEVHL